MNNIQPLCRSRFWKIVRTLCVLAIGAVAGAACMFFVVVDNSRGKAKANDAFAAYRQVRLANLVRQQRLDEVLKDLESESDLLLRRCAAKKWGWGLDSARDLQGHPLQAWQEARIYLRRYEDAQFSPEVKDYLRDVLPLQRTVLVDDVTEESLHLQPAPPLDVTGRDDSAPRLSVSDLKGKVVLLYFWATWCAPCVGRMPSVAALHSSLQDKGFQVLAVHSADIASNVNPWEFVRARGLDLPVVLDLGNTQKNYAITKWPTYMLLDKQGRVAWGPRYEAPSDEIIGELLQK